MNILTTLAVWNIGISELITITLPLILLFMIIRIVVIFLNHGKDR